MWVEWTAIVSWGTELISDMPIGQSTLPPAQNCLGQKVSDAPARRKLAPSPLCSGYRVILRHRLEVWYLWCLERGRRARIFREAVDGWKDGGIADHDAFIRR